MKKISFAGILLGVFFALSLFSNIVFAAEQSFSVILHSTPLASNGYAGTTGGFLNTNVGATVDFTRVIESEGVVNISWEWNFDNNYLDCAAYPEFDSDTLRCKVLAAGSTWVSIHMSPQMQDGTTWDHTSNAIQLVILGKFPPKISFKNLTITENYYSYVSPFPDLDFNTLLGKAAAELWRRDIISGYPDGEFKDSNNVNRAEAAKFLVNSKHGGPIFNTVGHNFPDVSGDDWFSDYVMTAYDDGILNGYPDGTFGPGNDINTAEFMKMITLTFNLKLNLPYTYKDVYSDNWFAAYAGAAQVYNLFPLRSSEYLEPGKLMTREEVAIAIYEYFNYQWQKATTVQY